MTVFVERGVDGNLVGVYASAQLDYAEEALADDDAAVVAFRARPRPRLVRKSLIVTRLQAAGLLAAASAALNADLYARERWYAADRPAILADDPEALALLHAVGADPATILAPE